MVLMPADRDSLDRVREAKSRVARKSRTPRKRRPTVPKVNQPTQKPTRKVATVGVSGAASVLVVFIANQAGLDVPPDVASAFTTVVTFASSYIVRNSYGKG